MNLIRYTVLIFLLLGTLLFGLSMNFWWGFNELLQEFIVFFPLFMCTSLILFKLLIKIPYSFERDSYIKLFLIGTNRKLTNKEVEKNTFSFKKDNNLEYYEEIYVKYIKKIIILLDSLFIFICCMFVLFQFRQFMFFIIAILIIRLSYSIFYLEQKNNFFIKDKIITSFINQQVYKQNIFEELNKYILLKEDFSIADIAFKMYIWRKKAGYNDEIPEFIRRNEKYSSFFIQYLVFEILYNKKIEGQSTLNILEKYEYYYYLKNGFNKNNYDKLIFFIKNEDLISINKMLASRFRKLL